MPAQSSTGSQNHPKTRKTMIIYLSGAITGQDPKEVCRVFKEAGRKVKSLEHEYRTPLAIPPPEDEEKDKWLYYMKKALRIALDCDAVYCLEGWNKSKGATIERNLFRNLGMKIYYTHTIDNIDKSKAKITDNKVKKVKRDNVVESVQ